MARYLEIDGKNTPKDIHLLGSCVGMRWRKTVLRSGVESFRPYRNYFSTTVNDPDWLDLEKRGLVDLVSTKKGKDIQTWMVNEQGRKYLGKFFNVNVLPEE